MVAKLEKTIAAQKKRIRSLEACIADNGLEAPADGAGDGDEDQDEPQMNSTAPAGRRSSVDNAQALEMAKASAILQERADELEQKLAAESEEKEFMKSLMDGEPIPDPWPSSNTNYDSIPLLSPKLVEYILAVCELEGSPSQLDSQQLSSLEI